MSHLNTASSEAAKASAPLSAFPGSALWSSPLLKTSEAAVHLGLAESTLEKMRVYGGGPKFVRPSRRAIRYRLDDLNQFLAEKVFGSTSEYTASVH